MMKYLIFLIILRYSAARKLPDYVEVCRPKHTDVSECILKNIRDVFKPKLKDGIPELGLPSIHPLLIPQAEIKLGENFKASVKDMKVWDLENLTIDDLKVDLDGNSLKIKLKVPSVHIETQYFVKGKLLLLELDSSGPGDINITDIDAIASVTGNREKRKDKMYFNLNNIDIQFKVGTFHIKLENLFPNKEQLTENANKILNDNQEVIIEEFGPVIVEVVKNFIERFIHTIFQKYSVDELFPDD